MFFIIIREREMKIVFKEEGNGVKLFAGEISLENLQSFVRKEFPNQKKSSLTFTDEDGDIVILAS